jgi:hypothetical protein
MKPDRMVETNHLMEWKDKTEYGRDLWGFFREIYGVCYTSITVDERTGEIEESD